MTLAVTIFAILGLLVIVLMLVVRAAFNAQSRAEQDRARLEVQVSRLVSDREANRLEEPLHKNPRVFTVPPVTVEWTAEDVSIWRKFLGESTGQRLLAICGGQALQEAMKECQGDKATPMAAGMDALLRFQFNLASEAVREKLSGESADQDSKSAEREQDAAQPVEIRRSF